VKKFRTWKTNSYCSLTSFRIFFVIIDCCTLVWECTLHVLQAWHVFVAYWRICSIKLLLKLWCSVVMTATFWYDSSGEHHNALDGNVCHVSTCCECCFQLENEGKGKAGKYTVTNAMFFFLPAYHAWLCSALLCVSCHGPHIIFCCQYYWVATCCIWCTILYMLMTSMKEYLYLFDCSCGT